MASGKHSAPARGTRKSRKVLAAVIVLCVVVVAGVGAYTLLASETPGDVREGEEIVVQIDSGSSAQSIADTLKENGVIEYANEFTSRVEELGVASSLQSGSYQFTGGQDIDSIIDAIANGRSGLSLTIPEGFTLKQISERVYETTGIDEDEFYEIASTQAALYADEFTFLSDCYGGSMEGFLFPDTYRVGFDATADDVIRLMLSEYQSKFSEIDMSYATSKNLTEYDVVTLASMVEKESRHESDRADIAAVFYNRLHAGMNLGSDVTTYYAVGKDLTEELTAEDLASTSPYNTRNPSNTSLPAGPICSPSLSSLEAAAQPSDASYLYFFYSESQDSVMFFDDLESFNAAWAACGS